LLLIGAAVAGLILNYFGSIQFRLSQMEQNQKQLQQAEVAEQDLLSTKLTALGKLSGEVTELERFLVPLSKMTRNNDADVSDLEAQLEHLKNATSDMEAGLQAVAAEKVTPAADRPKSSFHEGQEESEKPSEIVLKALPLDESNRTGSSLLPLSPGAASSGLSSLLHRGRMIVVPGKRGPAHSLGAVPVALPKD
jgi:septal ring factor EnvC (AmiA/AmiB activator)